MNATNTKIRDIDKKINDFDNEIKALKNKINSQAKPSIKEETRPSKEARLKYECKQQEAYKNGRFVCRKYEYDCNICLQKFDKKWILENYIEQQHQTNQKYPCPECGQTFFLKWRLGKHMKMHDGNIKVKPCHFFNNGKLCPFEKLGCKYLHKEAQLCRYRSCQYDKCQY